MTYAWAGVNISVHIIGELLEAASRDSLPGPLTFFNKTHELWTGEHHIALIFLPALSTASGTSCT